MTVPVPVTVSTICSNLVLAVDLVITINPSINSIDVTVATCISTIVIAVAIVIFIVPTIVVTVVTKPTGSMSVAVTVASIEDRTNNLVPVHVVLLPHLILDTPEQLLLVQLVELQIPIVQLHCSLIQTIDVLDSLVSHHGRINYRLAYVCHILYRLYGSGAGT